MTQAMTLHAAVRAAVANLKATGTMPTDAEIIDIEVKRIGSTLCVHVEMTKGPPLYIEADIPEEDE
jgi:hypothetical protein